MGGLQGRELTRRVDSSRDIADDLKMKTIKSRDKSSQEGRRGSCERREEVDVSESLGIRTQEDLVDFSL